MSHVGTRLDTTTPPTREAVGADLTARFGELARIAPRGRWRRRPTGSERTVLAAEVHDGRRRRVWLDLPLPGPTEPPDHFRVTAVIAAHNEEDILSWTVEQHLAQGVEVVVIDHGSDDGTAAVLDQLEAAGKLAGRHFMMPAVPWPEILAHKVLLIEQSGADWGIHVDADEVRTGPFPEVPLRTALWAAHTWGATVADHTVVNHLPVAGRTNDDPRHLHHVDLALRPGYFLQQRAWRVDAGVDLQRTNGHLAEHDGAAAYPLNFRCDHYIVRSQAHGRRKVAERRLRFAAERVNHPQRHSHYDHVENRHRFEVPTGTLPTATPAWEITNRARLLFRSGMAPDPDYPLV